MNARRMPNLRRGDARGQSLVEFTLIVPVFIYRHYIQDKGSFPREMAEDLDMVDGEKIVKRAGYWPYLVLALGVAVVAITHKLAVY